MRRPARGARLAAIPWLLAIAPAGLLLAAPPQTPDLTTVLERVGRYVEQYQQDFSLLVCDERFAQKYEDAHIAQKRQLVSEFALARVQVGDDWLWQAFRDVLEVDGRRIEHERNRLEALFSSSQADLIERARVIAVEGAKFNLGPYRTINVPTLALEYLAPGIQARQRFSKTGEEIVSGVRTWRVAFEEQAWPTIIQTPDGEDVPALGTVWVEPGTGRVVRTELRPQQPTIRFPQKSKIVVTYALDPRLGLWVPVRMEESHKRTLVSISGEATYSNFRRYETAARLKDRDD